MKLVLILFSLMMFIRLSGCETIKGIGKGLQNIGKSLEKKSKE